MPPVGTVLGEAEVHGAGQEHPGTFGQCSGQVAGAEGEGGRSEGLRHDAGPLVHRSEDSGLAPVSWWRLGSLRRGRIRSTV